MKLESRMLSSINHRAGAVFLRSDVRDLGSASQVSEALKALQKKGLIVRISKGAYAKSRTDSKTGEIVLAATPEDIATELFIKLGIKAHVSKNTAPSGDGELTVETVSPRVRRRLLIGDKQAVYNSPPAFSVGAKLNIPTEGLQAFVADLIWICVMSR